MLHLAQSKGLLLYVANYLYLCFIIIVSTIANFVDAVKLVPCVEMLATFTVM